MSAEKEQNPANPRNPNEPSSNLLHDSPAPSRLLWILTAFGFGSLAISALTLLVTEMLRVSDADPLAGDWTLALGMVVARTFGTFAFLAGAAFLVLEQWTSGTLLLISSIALPVVAYLLFGTI